MNRQTQLIKTLTSPSHRFFMTMQEYISELAQLIPVITGKNAPTAPDADPAPQTPAYPGLISASLTNHDANEIEPEETGAIAYYRVEGTIMADAWCNTSTKKLLNWIADAERNPKISAHFFHISSAGGEAWLIDQLAAAIHNTKKPAHAHIERVAGSAAYYIASQCDHISASTPFDIVGSIGTMISFMDVQPLLEKWGVKFVEEYSSYSNLKNKKYRDLIGGKPDQFIKEELDPLALQFINDVKRGRPQLAELPLDHKIFRGETFYASSATKIGLIDQVESISDAVARLHKEASQQSKQATRRQKAINLLNQ